MANQSKLELILNFLLTGDGLKKAGDGLKEIHSKLSALKAAAKETWEIFKDVASVYFAPLKTVAVPAIAAVTTAFGLAIKAVREFAGQELGEADVKSALIAMGQYTDQYRDRLIQLSDTYQTTTGLADDMWLKSLAQLTRFGMNASNVDKVAEALKNLTGLMDGNLDGATDMLAKAMQGEFGMFSRYGIIIKQTGDQIKDLDAAITAINSKGVGLLEARADTLSGKWTGMKNQANEVFEAIGKKLSSSLDIGDAITTAKGWLATLTSAVQSGGLGDLISKGGKELRDHIEAAVKWAEKIAKAIEDSGKPVEQVFSDALKAAAKVLLDAIAAGLKASLEIWKLVGQTIFSTFKEEMLKIDLPGFGGIGGSNRKEEAAANASNLSDSEASGVLVKSRVISPELAKNPDYAGAWPGRLSVAASSGELSKNTEASLASMTSPAEITAAFDAFKTAITTIATNLGTEVKTAVETAAGIGPDSADKAPGKSTITIQGSDGEEITKTLEEYIKELGVQNDKLAEAAQAGTDSATEQEETSTKLLESVKTTSESATKASDAAVEAHGKVTTALDLSKDASLSAAQAADRNIQITEQVVALTATFPGRFSALENKVNNMAGQLNSMRT